MVKKYLDIAKPTTAPITVNYTSRNRDFERSDGDKSPITGFIPFSFCGPQRIRKKAKEKPSFPKWTWVFSSFTHPTKTTHSLLLLKKEKFMSVWPSVNHFQHFNKIIVPFSKSSTFYNPEEELSPPGPMLPNWILWFRTRVFSWLLVHAKAWLMDVYDRLSKEAGHPH